MICPPPSIYIEDGVFCYKMKKQIKVGRAVRGGKNADGPAGFYVWEIGSCFNEGQYT